MTVKKKFTIEGGKVHDVGYRLFLFERGEELCIPNFFAKNVKEKGEERVIILIGGEEEQVAEFVEFAKTNYPVNAEVTGVKEDPVHPERVMSIESYAHLLQAEQLSKGVTAILGINKKQGGMLEKQDVMIEKQDETISIIKSGNEMLAEKQNVMIGKQDQTIAIIKSGVDEMREFRTETQQNFANLDIKYGKIAENMEKIMKSMEDTSKKTGEVLERLAQQQENFNRSIDKLTDAILKLAELKK